MPHPINKCSICGKNEWIIMMVIGSQPGDSGTYIVCNNCESKTALYETRAEAIEAWNNGIIETVD